MIPEIKAKELLEKYEGSNNQLLEWKLKFINIKNFKLTRPQAEYVIKYHEQQPKVAKKYLNITASFGKKIMEEKLLPEPPEKVWCEKLLCESEKAYHLWGRVIESEKNYAFWIPKTAIIQEEKKLDYEIDYSKYSNRPPLEHQKIAIEKLLANNRFILADDQGVGKTTSAIIASIESGAKKVLIVCPASLKINWKKEIENYTDKKIFIIEGRKWGSTFDYYIINYDIIKNYHTTDKSEDSDDYKLLVNAGFDLAIVDEAHYLSNPQASRTKLLNDVLEKIPKVWLLSGTPMASRPINYFNLLKIVKSPLAINWQTYVRRYCKGYQFTVGNRKIWNTSGASNLDELRELTKNIILRRMKTDVLDLPEKIINPIYLELKSTFYDEELEDFMRISEDKKKDESITVTLNRLMKIRQLIAVEKIQYTCELIDKILEQDKKVIVFTNFTNVVDILYEKYKKKSVILDGRMSKDKRQESIDSFQNNDKVKIFIGNIVAAGVGITLTAAEAVIMNDLSFVPGHHSQAEDRCIYGGQNVITSEGYKKIENIKIGDFVYTHNGNFKKVIDTHTHLERKKIRVDIESYGFEGKTSLTHDHKLFVYNNKNKNFEWIESGELDIMNHFLTLKSNQLPKEPKKLLQIENFCEDEFLNNYNTIQKNDRLKKLPSEIILTDELLYAFGFYIAEGWSIDNDMHNQKKSSTVNICQKIDNKKMYDASEYIIEIIKKNFLIDKHSSYIKNNVKTCTIYSKNLAKNFNKWFGVGSENKKLPYWVNELNENQLTHLLNGYFHGDGYHRKNTQNMVTTSPLLCSQLIISNANLGRPVSLRIVKPKKSNNKTAYYVEFNTSNEISYRNRIRKINDYIVYPINSITKRKSPHNDERVYDISVEDDHSFVTNVFNVHNCYRYGQKNSVLVYYPIFENTVERIVYNILQKKKNIIDQVMGDGEYSESFSRELINELF